MPYMLTEKALSSVRGDAEIAAQTPENMDVFDAIEEMYETEKIYKAWIICGDDAEVMEMASALDKRYHTVVTIVEGDVEDERPLYMNRIRTFQNYARVLVLSFATWQRIADDIEVHVLPEQNLTIFGNIDDDLARYAERRIAEAAKRGFYREGVTPLILRLGFSS